MEMQITNTAEVKTHNKKAIVNAFKKLGCGTKNDLAKHTGLSAATCNTLLNELFESGEIMEQADKEPCIGRAGRPAKKYALNQNFSYAVCIALTYENQQKYLTYSIINLAKEIMLTETISRAFIDYEMIKRLLTGLIANHPRIKAVGIGIPGIVTYEQKIELCDIAELCDCPMRELLQKDFDLETVVANDMNLSAYGFFQINHMEKRDSIVYISLYKENFPGAGIMIDGQILYGHTSFAGEISFLPFRFARESYITLLENREETIKIVADFICSFTATINPKTILIGGRNFDEDMKNEIAMRCGRQIDQKHLPEINYIEDTAFYYNAGLRDLTLQN